MKTKTPGWAGSHRITLESAGSTRPGNWGPPERIKINEHYHIQTERLNLIECIEVSGLFILVIKMRVYEIFVLSFRCEVRCNICWGKFVR